MYIKEDNDLIEDFSDLGIMEDNEECAYDDNDFINPNNDEDRINIDEE